MQQVHQEKISTVIGLARHWIITMPDKPTGPENGSGKVWIGLKHLLQEFSSFASQYCVLLQKAPLGNPRFVKSQGVDHLLQDFNILSRACEQRKDKTTLDGFAYRLAEAEGILEGYCNRWNPSDSPKFVKLQTPVVYFEKLYGITRAIYAPEVPIIAIPLSEYDQPDNWLALSHEFGHHIFWNALKSVRDFDEFQHNLQNTLTGSLPGQNSRDTWLSWLEEIFADVLGAMLEGPKFAVACQDFAMERIRKAEDMAKDDHEHPALFLRPLIAIQVLREIASRVNNNELTALIPKIEQRWKTFYAQAVPETLYNSKIAVADLSAELVPVIQAILNGTYWPDQKCLWNLLQYWGCDKVEIPSLELGDTAPLLLKIDGPIAIPLDEDIPDRLREVWEYLQAQPSVRNAKYGEDPAGEALAHWDVLLNMGLDESHQHDNAHTECLRHWYFWASHKHDLLSTAVMC